jgi:hypothetical protein
MQTKFPIRIAAPALLALLLAACATAPRTDERFGESVRATLASQIASPAAVRNSSAASGIDGRAARAGQERYEHSFAKTEAAAPTVVGAK